MQSVQLTADWDPRAGVDASPEEERERFSDDGSQVWRSPQIALTEREEPEPARDEVVVDVWYSGICGSDLHLTASDEDGYMQYASFASLPNTTGHEFAGVVSETGEQVTEFSEGDLVTSEVTEYCGVCEMCRRSLPFRCTQVEEVGFTKPGSHAEYVAVPEKNVWDVSALGSTFDSKADLLKAAATIEPTAISYFGLYVRADDVTPGAYFVFHGGGPIGLTGMNLARAGGAGGVVLAEPRAARRQLAREMGFELVLDPSEEGFRDRVMELTDGHGADVHVEAAGAPDQTYPAIEDTLGPRGKVVQLGISNSRAALNLEALQSRHAAIYGSKGQTGNATFPRVIRLMADGAIDNRPLITDVYDLSRAKEAFARARQRRGGKVLLDCRK